MLACAAIAFADAAAGVRCVSKSGDIAKTGETAVCEASSDGTSKAIAVAKKGGVASDSDPPACDTRNGGSARVRSSAGNWD
jgi:hypothetical protein